MIDDKVFSEVYVILNQLEEKSLKKIPEKIFNQIKENAKIDVDYIDKNVPLEELNIMSETKEFLAIISYYYFCDEEERQKWDDILNENERKYQEKLKQKYNPEEIFKTKQEYINKENEKSVELNLVEYKEKFIVRLINKIKQFFKII